MINKCPKCGSKMTLNVITSTWDCEKCGFQTEDTVDFSMDNELETEEDNAIEEENTMVEDNSFEEENHTEGDLILNHCSNCNFSFIGDNIDKCFVCNGDLEKSSIDINYSKYLDYKLDLGDAIHNYKRKLTFRFLCPFSFRGKKTLNRLKGVFIPMYSYDTSLDGEVVFNASDINVLDTSKKEKSMQYFKVVCKGHFDYKDVLINASSKFNNSILEKIDDFDYKELKDINELVLGEKLIYKDDCEDSSILERLKNRCVNNSVRLMDELVNHTKKKVVDNGLDFKYDSKGIILVPVYVLTNKYKGKTYYYIMNGQNGNTYIKTPIGIIETIVFSVLLFSILFAIMMLIAMYL